MYKSVMFLLLSISSFVYADTVYVDGKAVDQKIIDQTTAKWKDNPMASRQMSNPAFRKEMLQTIGMQQALLAEGKSQGLENSPAYNAKLNEMKPMIFAQIMREQSLAKPITDAEIKAKYSELKATAAKQVQYNTSHILVKDLTTANDIEKQLKNGSKFADIAKKYSTDTASKTNGGSLGWSDGNGYAAEFSKAMKELKKGEYTKTPVKTQFGYHIIMINDIGNGAMNFASYDSMKERLKQQIQMDRAQAVFVDIKNKHHIEVK